MLKNLPNDQVESIVATTARSTLDGGNFVRAFAEPTVDSEGEDALRITIVVEPGAIERITGDTLLDTLVRIQEQLREAGEERFPIVEYATEEELAHIDDEP